MQAPVDLDLTSGPTRLMAILNATPDSFSGDGVLAPAAGGGATLDARVEALLAAAPDLLDVGAESTRPGYRPVEPALQIERLGPAFAALERAGSTVPLSIDTCSAEVARFAVDHGAVIINDVSGFRRDPDILRVAATTGVHVVATHTLETEATAVHHPTLGGGYEAPHPGRPIVEVVRDGLLGLIRTARDAGVDADRIIVDPGIGFGKDTAQNLAVTARLDQLVGLGHPVLYGPSRKRFIGEVTGRPPSERLAGTCAVVALAAAAGVAVVRVHDARAVRDVLAMVAAVVTAPVAAPG